MEVILEAHHYLEIKRDLAISETTPIWLPYTLNLTLQKNFGHNGSHEKRNRFLRHKLLSIHAGDKKNR